jgi:hypothetical protein
VSGVCSGIPSNTTAMAVADDHVGAEAVPLLVSAAIAVEQPAVTELHPVDGDSSNF